MALSDVCIYPRFGSDGIGTYVGALHHHLGVPAIDCAWPPLSLRQFVTPPPTGFGLVHVPHFVLPLRTPRARTVCTIHDITPLVLEGAYTGAALAYLRVRIGWSVRNADHLICISESTRSDVVRLFGRTRDISVIEGGVHPPLPAAEIAAPEYSFPFVLCVGRRRAHKNTARCIAAVAQVAQRNDVHLVLAGAPDIHDAEHRHQAALLGISSRVHFVGRLTPAQLAGHYREAVALLFPSIYEGYGLPIIEAMSYGCPVITSDRAAMPEAAGGAAELVDPYELGSIAAAVERILNSEPLQADLRERGLARAAALSWKVTAERTAEVYNAVLDGRRIM